MLKFGKKVTYRPLLVSIFFTLIPLSAAIKFNWLTAYLLSILVFSVIFFVYYLSTLPMTFNYWEADHDMIRYNDTHKISNRLQMMLFPFKNQLTTINKQDIQSITVTGKIANPAEITVPLQVTAYYAILTPILSMIKNPIDLELIMKDGQTIKLSVSRDYAYGSKKTIEKLNQFFDSLDDAQIKIINYPNHKISFN
ncbi:hypothetical protein ACFQAV_08195 [Companilactobacillus huachuanensis]|uniref:Uncharacterized protein n=1 Tax=Companilactobacillus huachuanensis TaxID=2559914 RepID=A0ABW1RLG2_9LACO|nr:hypothetical protein [Companilactobacillus huachuanensis]